MDFLRALLGLAFFVLASWLLSSHRGRFPVRVVFGGLALQLVLGALLLGTSYGERFFKALADFFAGLIAMAEPGAKLVFGPLADPVAMGEVFGPAGGFVFAFAGTGLAAILFFSALMAVLYHLGVMQLLVWLLAKVMSGVLGVSGAESMAVAANVFVGQTEAPLVVRPYLDRMTLSELNALMTGGFATIAGSVLAVYMGILGPELGPHLLTASVLSAPAAFLIAKVLLPETEMPETGGKVELRFNRSASNVIEAAANGTTDGLRLWLNVIAMLIAFMGLVALADWMLAGASGNSLIPVELSLQKIFGWVFAPIAWIIGVSGWHDCQLFGSLLGTKVAVNEFVAFSGMTSMYASADPASLAVSLEAAGITAEHLREASELTASGGPLPTSGPIYAAAQRLEDPVFHSTRTAQMAAYALCGFANFASIGIQIGGLGALAEGRKPELARLALKAMIGGAFASWMTATVAGMFL